MKRALARYAIKVVRQDVDPERNPFGLLLDCYASVPRRIEIPASLASPSGVCRLSGEMK